MVFRINRPAEKCREESSTKFVTVPNNESDFRIIILFTTMVPFCYERSKSLSIASLFYAGTIIIIIIIIILDLVSEFHDLRSAHNWAEEVILNCK